MDRIEDAALLVGIGAPRTGTKWLSGYFSSHPQILMSPIRVLHYFDARFVPAAAAHDDRFAARLAKARGNTSDLADRVRMATDATAYIDYFRKRWKGEGVFVDVTPGYAGLPPEAFRAMAAIHPRVRILFTMRNPIDRHWSGLRLRKANDPAFDLAAELARVGAEAASSKGRRDYEDTISNLDQTVAPGTAIIRFFETLLTEAGIADLCDELGVDRVPADLATPQNQSEPNELSTADRALLYRRFAPTYRFAADRFGDALPETWRRDIDAFDGAATD